MKITMEKLGIQLIILALCTGACFPAYILEDKKGHSDSSGYQLVKKAKGIELYEKWYEISSNKLAREVKVEYHINTSIELAAALIENEIKATQWNKGSSQYKIIHRDANSWISYIQYDLPWPLDNQDCVLDYNVSHTSGEQIIIDFKSIEHEIFPATEHVSRILDVKGKWIFQATPTGTQVDYSITTLPSPTLPRWVTDPIVRNNLIDTMDEFRNILESSKH
jgi:hypothetical protein